jgi:hypothetical protein
MSSNTGSVISCLDQGNKQLPSANGEVSDQNTTTTNNGGGNMHNLFEVDFM